MKFPLSWIKVNSVQTLLMKSTDYKIKLALNTQTTRSASQKSLMITTE